MAESWKPTWWKPSDSYPWLSIAHHFGLDYADVLKAADFYLGRSPRWTYFPEPVLLAQFDEAARYAASFFLYVQAVGMNIALASGLPCLDKRVPSAL